MAIIKQLKKYAALYIGVIVIYMAALLLVYAIPNSAVAENVKISQEYLELEGTIRCISFSVPLPARTIIPIRSFTKRC